MTDVNLDKFVLDPSCRLWLPLAHMDGRAGGANIRSRDAYGVNLTIDGAYWTPLGWHYDGVDDQITALADDSAHLDFTSEDFSAVVRFLYRPRGDTENLVSRFQWNTTGWSFWVNGTDSLQVYTFQDGVNQQTNSGSAHALSDGQVYTAGLSRSGALVAIYINGAYKCDTPGSHLNPTTSPRRLGVGSNGYNAGHFKGNMKAVAVWARALAPVEHARFHDLFKEAFP